MAKEVLSAPVSVSTPPTGLDECFFFIYLVSDFLGVRFSVSSGCTRRRSVSTYTSILVPKLKVFGDVLRAEKCLLIIVPCPLLDQVPPRPQANAAVELSQLGLLIQ